ncbi:N-acetylmuramoyl-L-alanine amidase [Bacillus pseudomycoides]|uniref:N-acetylmuramoyl-L-alanine amidase n=1 Tax=Bacillus pseudomycoides TaxID=64104 RepID=A0ABD6SXY4_9BACI|nr:hypothetical protein [Bacillus pseudomycoides]EEM02085.1 N-acetylmuramoyl-L-alanine amidase family 2 [Bacillus pseudomycoides]EEM07613.1 N-acetylmuramoyl-L-alanine amidase family 2 [Bacillus pseudomycoides]MBD5798954.1 N-acetylmuramoyl-L-alanine amidase [Bacillus pseudomycoides]PDZ12741.1 N-acetylmuramoyl-L-alanine amidase [Bacillus pseudomycoides]PDZ72985.1 N-acetylmuramoyl-L-alanine amidase [Bacillus pseudomycoides]
MKRTYNTAEVEFFVPEQPPKPAEIPKGVTDGIAYIEGYNLTLPPLKGQAGKAIGILATKGEVHFWYR